MRYPVMHSEAYGRINNRTDRSLYRCSSSYRQGLAFNSHVENPCMTSTFP